MENLNDRLIKSQLVRSLNMIEGGGGEVWEDITSLFTATSEQTQYFLETDNLRNLTKNIPIRITLELFDIASATNVVTITGTTQLYVTVNYNGYLNLLINTIYSSNTAAFTGRLRLSSNSISYQYGVTIPEGKAGPKILKIEMLMGV